MNTLASWCRRRGGNCSLPPPNPVHMRRAHVCFNNKYRVAGYFQGLYISRICSHLVYFSLYLCNTFKEFQGFILIFMNLHGLYHEILVEI